MGFSRRASKLNRAVFEALETRQLMSAVTWQVTNTSNDPTVSGSLPWAVVQANHDSGDTISFSTLPNGSDIYLAGPLDIQSNVTITGLGRTNLTIDGGSTSNIFTVESGVTATITGLTLADGNASGNGGAILNSGDLNLDGCVFLNNIAGGSGGAIYNAGALEVTNTTFSGDKATGNVAGNGGGGIYNVNFATILTSSFTNEGALDGGGDRFRQYVHAGRRQRHGAGRRRDVQRRHRVDLQQHAVRQYGRERRRRRRGQRHRRIPDDR
jgi:predicted outer membrane repeat protein